MEAADNIFIGRQPILDSRQQLVAYELLFRSAESPNVGTMPDGTLATGRVLANILNQLGLHTVLGGKRAFLNVTAEFLQKGLHELLPHDQAVLEILEDVEPTPELAARCAQLRAEGYELALDDFVYSPAWEPLLELVTYVKLDVRALGMEETARQAGLLCGREFALLAEKVETIDEFRRCLDLGFDYFQGYYFAKPELLGTKRIDPSLLNAVNLFNLVIGKADIARIEAGFRQDVALSYNLLKFINSVGMGLARKVNGIRHALVVLGHAKLARWLSLLMLSLPGHGVASQTLFRVALTRARFIELLGQKRLPPKEHDLLFMMGMFSALDVLFGKPLSEALSGIALPPEVGDALLHGSGRLAPYLQLVRACEELDVAAVQRLAGNAGVTLTEINAAQHQALAWAGELDQAA